VDGKVIYSNQVGVPDNSIAAAMAHLDSVGYNFPCNNRGDYYVRCICGTAYNPSAAGNGRSTTNSEALLCQCAAGEACQAPPNADLAKSPHRCWGCRLRVHSIIFCAMSFEAPIIDKPYLVGRLLPSSRTFAEGADNKMHCMCFTCFGKMTEPVTVGVLQPAADKENVTTNNLIEDCSWDNIVVTTTLTNAASRTKKGEPLKPINATCLQGFCINGKLLSTASIVKDHLQRWAIRRSHFTRL
jgi:hypothetical protein